MLTLVSVNDKCIYFREPAVIIPTINTYFKSSYIKKNIEKEEIIIDLFTGNSQNLISEIRLINL